MPPKHFRRSPRPCPRRQRRPGRGRRAAGGHRPVARRGRAAARCRPWRHGDQRRDGAGQGRRQEAARAGRGDRRKTARRRSRRQGRGGGPGLHQSDAQARGLDRGAAHGGPRRAATTAAATSAGGEPVNVEYVSANPTGPMHVGHCRGAVFGDALASLLAFAGLRGDARILHQRCRRAGRRARALGLSALPRGAGRGHRRHPGGALSGRLSQAGRRGAGAPNTAQHCSAESRRANGCRRPCASARSR